MIRILHFADLHLGVETYGRIDPATGLSSRLGDFLAAFDEMVEYALSNSLDLVLFCGDAYKSRDPSQTHQREFAKRIGRLAAGGIPVFLLVGNHDLPNAVARATAVDIFDTLKVSNVFIANRPSSHLIQTKSGPLQIVALPWVRRSALLSREDSKNLSFDQLNERLELLLTEWLAGEARSLDPNLPAILAAHVSVSNAKSGSERTMMMGRDHILLQSNLANPAFDYIALGHIHKHQVLSFNPPAVYSGSLQGIDFSEEGEDKGFYAVELDQTRGRGERVVAYDFQPVATRRFITIQVNADTEEPTAAVLRAIARKEVKEAIVRVQIKVSAARQGLIQDGEIHKALKDAHYIAAIAREVEREHRIRLGSYPAQEITPVEALKIYLESKKTPPDRIKVLLDYGERLMHQSSVENEPEGSE